MARCVHHPGRESVLTYGTHHYCAECQRGIIAARLRVDRHVEPKDCFIWYERANTWSPIAGTGCAHWVAHQQNITSGRSSEQCLLGFTYRVRTLVTGMTRVAGPPDVRVNDIYVTPSADHTGIVVQVTPAARPGGVPTIAIRHDSSRAGQVTTGDFARNFSGQGVFYRR